MWVVGLIAVVLIIVLAMMFSNINSGGASSGAGGNSSGNVDVKYLDSHLETLYDAYSELCQKGYANVIYHIMIYSLGSNGIGIDIQLDGSYFLKGMRNDILTYYYTLPAGEDPTSWHNRHAELPSKTVSNREIATYISGYKQRNSEKGDFLKLLKTV
ncbi:MAG: hypothetical protein K6A74_09295 [Lachnospiraceae bacterium]|nr:hypothetical protein [Lachnospiraceae bacterium]